MRTPSSKDRIDRSRRGFLVAAVAGAGTLATFRGVGSLAAGGASPLVRPTFRDFPFALGVASGEPSADGFVLWTRLAPSALAGDPSDVAVDWVVAEDERFSRVVRRGGSIAGAEWAHSLHVEVDGLAPDRRYWYRFFCRGEASPIGCSRTLPEPGMPTSRFRLAVASCQHYEQGYFSAYRHMLDDDLDLIVHVGDYIYEGSWGAQIRAHESPGAAVTLDDYRARHAWYKRDADLQRAHAAYPWLVTWDDHEVANDYAGLGAGNEEESHAFAQRRAAAYRAYYEHMPLRARHRPDARGMPMFGRFRIGDLAEINLLDDRQYRSSHACAERGDVVVGCDQRFSSARTMLGDAQERWLFDGLSNSAARWNVIAQQTLIAPFESRANGGESAIWTDGWDGYAHSRGRLLDHIGEHRVPNVVTLGGDVHAFYVSDLKRDFRDERAPAIATEFVGTSITSDDVDYEAVVRDLPRNPHIRYFESRSRGYLRCEATPSEWRTEMRAVGDVRDAKTGVATIAAFSVVDGVAGAQ